MKKFMCVLLVIIVCISGYIVYQKSLISKTVATFGLVCEDCKTGLSAQTGTSGSSIVIGHREYLCQNIDRIWCSKCTTSTNETSEEIKDNNKTITATNTINYGGKLTKTYVVETKEIAPNTLLCIDGKDEKGEPTNTFVLVISSKPVV